MVTIMEGKKISRNDMHFNFLKNIILRLDFQGIVESEIESILPTIKPYLKSKGFNRFEEKTSSQINIDIAGNINSDIIPTKSIRNQKISSFVNDERGVTFDISTDFICININSAKYVPFEDYSCIIIDTARTLREKIDFFTVKRLGIRKINVCVIDNKEKILEYFSKDCFGYYSGLSDIETLASKKVDFFKTEDFQANLSCALEQGKLDDKESFKVTVDIDLYIDKFFKIFETLDNAEKMNKLNETIFSIFLDTLTFKLKQALTCSNEFELESIFGVESNE